MHPFLIFDLLGFAQLQGSTAAGIADGDCDRTPLVDSEEPLRCAAADARFESAIWTVLCVGRLAVLVLCFGADPVWWSAI